MACVYVYIYIYIYRDNVGIMEKNMATTRVYGVNIRTMQKKPFARTAAAVPSPRTKSRGNTQHLYYSLNS